MKPAFVVQMTALLGGVSLTLMYSLSSAHAATFEQKEMEQNRVVAVAVPLAQGNRYTLLILEQLSSTKLCWQQSANNPGIIDPLLLRFNFANICGRSTDSNGYSVRIAGEDKGLDYRLSVVRQGDHLALMALPMRNAQTGVFEIARSEGLASGFLQLKLNPDWRFTKRAYQGKALGHIYLTRDLPSGGTAHIASRNSATNGSWSSLASLSRDNASVYHSSLPSRSRSRYGTPNSQYNLSRPLGYRNPSTSFTTPIEIPVPAPRLSAIRTLPLPADGAASVAAAGATGVLPVPTGSIPMGTAGDEPDLITANTPSLNLDAIAPGMSGALSAGAFPVAMVIPRYRVFVSPTDTKQQRAVKTLVPDAFRSSYQGRAVLQVGAFEDRVKADEVIDLLNRNGIASILATDE
jgi:hypothetical protein